MTDVAERTELITPAPAEALAGLDRWKYRKGAGQ